MPFRVPDERFRQIPDTRRGKIKYNYPLDLDLRPGSKLHNNLVDKVFEAAEESHHEISKRYGSWEEVDKTNTAFIRQDAAERSLTDFDDRKPTSIVIPMSFVVKQTLLTALSASFLVDSPFRYSGSGPEDVLGAIMLEKNIEQQVMRSKMKLAIHVALSDSLSYGIGIISPIWQREWGLNAINDEIQVVPGFTTKNQRIEEDVLLYEGNILDNISPYSYLPDPNVAAHRLQEGEFVGYVDRLSYMRLLEMERTSEGTIFNVRHLQRFFEGRSQFFHNLDPGRERTGMRRGRQGIGLGDRDKAIISTSPIDVIFMFMNIIPQIKLS